MVLSPRTVLLTDGDGRRIGAVTVVSDITLLEELSEMKTEFVSLVSHELRTPLTSIMGFAQTLHGDTGSIGPEDREEFLGIIEQESNRLLVMINDLLDMSRMEAGRALAMSYKQVDLLQLAEHVVRFQQVTTTAHRFLFEFPEAGISVEADRDKVEQILTNLISNAIKYSPRGGDVVLGASGPAEAGEEVVVFVRDQGLGMDAEQIAQLFQPYQRVDRDAIKGIRGTGLGLYLVRGLVEAHGGRIWAESEPGSGSTFYFSLPTRPPEQESGA
jgi:two-component system phosphate regulon sensor histidine kinase PhoR